MATADATNAKQLPSFSNVKEFEQLAIMLRSEGKKYTEITNTINAEYDLAYKEMTLRQWFMSGGKLEQAYNEYLEWHADQSVMEAKLKIKRMSVKAADTLDELMNDGTAGNTRQRAAQTVLAKYIPDRQVVTDETKADEIPSAIGTAGDEVLTNPGEENGSDNVADTPQGEAASGTPGPAGS